jgi:hypothetical protein
MVSRVLVRWRASCGTLSRQNLCSLNICLELQIPRWFGVSGQHDRSEGFPVLLHLRPDAFTRVSLMGASGEAFSGPEQTRALLDPSKVCNR